MTCRMPSTFPLLSCSCQQCGHYVCYSSVKLLYIRDNVSGVTSNFFPNSLTHVKDAITDTKVQSVAGRDCITRRAGQSRCLIVNSTGVLRMFTPVGALSQRCAMIPRIIRRKNVVRVRSCQVASYQIT